MKAENISLLEDLFEYKLSPGIAGKPDLPAPSEKACPHEEEKPGAGLQGKTGETFLPASPANHKRPTIL
jgi:hypothetical protein